MRDISTGRIPLTRFYVSDYIFDEAMTFIECVLGDHGLAQGVGEALLSSPFTILLRVGDEVFQETWDRFKASRGRSFTDCSSFVLMEKNGVNHAFSFDEHFKDEGFQILP